MSMSTDARQEYQMMDSEQKKEQIKICGLFILVFTKR